MKSKNLQPKLLCPARLSFKIKEEIRSFPDKKKLKEFVNTKPALPQMLKGFLEKKKKEEGKKKKKNKNRGKQLSLIHI